MEDLRDQNTSQSQQFAADQLPGWAQTFLRTINKASLQQNGRITQLKDKLIAALSPIEISVAEFTKI